MYRGCCTKIKNKKTETQSHQKFSKRFKTWLFLELDPRRIHCDSKNPLNKSLVLFDR